MPRTWSLDDLDVWTVFNVDQTAGLKLRPLQAAPGPEWEGHERAEALIKASGMWVDHVAGDRAYYSLKADRVVLPERNQFDSQPAYTHPALHELGHATGHPDRLNRATLVNHGGFGTETYAREELRAEIAAMMTGEQLGVGHEPRHGTAYVSSWIKALENDPREIRANSGRCHSESPIGCWYGSGSGAGPTTGQSTSDRMAGSARGESTAIPNGLSTMRRKWAVPRQAGPRSRRETRP